MKKKDFIDEVTVFARAGNGGAGSQHFYRGRCIPKGGPDGGDGGRGGSIVFEGRTNVRTLIDFRYRKHLLAPHGADGSSAQRTGAIGKDLVLPVPLGTIIRKEDGTLLGEILRPYQRCVVAAGGRGGRGNTHFKSATRQTPRYAQPGEKGEVHRLHLELKLLGDVGLVGFANVGKSTLLSVLSAARPKVGNYAFTTLKPHVGVVFYQKHQSFVMADLPGLIVGAAQGKGLGLQFLRHIERSKILLLTLPADAEDIVEMYRALRRELVAYDQRLLAKQSVIAVTKSDLLEEKRLDELVGDLMACAADVPVIPVSAWQEKGLQKLKRTLWNCLMEDAAMDEVETFTC